MTKLDLTAPLALPDSMVNLAPVHAAGHEITIGEGHLERQYLEIADEVKAAIEAVLPTGKYTLGPNVRRFEEEFAAYCDSQVQHRHLKRDRSPSPRPGGDGGRPGR